MPPGAKVARRREVGISGVCESRREAGDTAYNDDSPAQRKTGRPSGARNRPKSTPAGHPVPDGQTSSERGRHLLGRTKRAPNTLKDPAGNLRFRTGIGPKAGPNQVQHGPHKPAHNDSERFWADFGVFRRRSETFKL